MGCFRSDSYKVERVPEGFSKATGATTAPIGWVWYRKGSLFNGTYEHVLVTIEESKRYEEEQCTK